MPSVTYRVLACLACQQLRFEIAAARPEVRRLSKEDRRKIAGLPPEAILLPRIQPFKYIPNTSRPIVFFVAVFRLRRRKRAELVLHAIKRPISSIVEQHPVIHTPAAELTPDQFDAQISFVTELAEGWKRSLAGEIPIYAARKDSNYLTEDEPFTMSLIDYLFRCDVAELDVVVNAGHGPN